MVKIGNSLEELLGIPEKKEEKKQGGQNNQDNENAELAQFLSSKPVVKSGCPEPPSVVNINRSFEIKLKTLFQKLDHDNNASVTVLFLILGDQNLVNDLILPKQDIGEYSRISQQEIDNEIDSLDKNLKIYGWGVCSTRPRRYSSSSPEKNHFYFMERSQWSSKILDFPLKHLLYIDYRPKEKFEVSHPPDNAENDNSKSGEYYFLSGYPCGTIQMKKAERSIINDSFDETLITTEIDEMVARKITKQAPRQYYSDYYKPYQKQYEKKYERPTQQTVETPSKSRKILDYIYAHKDTINEDIQLMTWEIESILTDFVNFAEELKKKEESK